MKRVKQKIFAGQVLEQMVYNVHDAADMKKVRFHKRFRNNEEYEKFKDTEGLKRFTRLINANFTPKSQKGTLTCRPEDECHTFGEMRRVRDAFIRRIRRRCPDVRMVIVMGRARSNGARIHLHYIIDGADEATIRRCWTWGDVVECVHLRSHNVYDGIDCGQDYKGIAAYYWKHWTPDQGRNHYYATKNLVHPKPEAAEEVKREYSPAKPPRAPKGYVLVEARETEFGYLYFKYVKIQRRRNC